MDRACIVIDLGFGDAGKGLVTDALVRRLEAHTVVRFNGGSQAGHNVVLRDGRHHTFSQLGAGTFVPGVKTLLSRYMVVHPTALVVEAEHLARQGVGDALARLSIDGRALVTTPYHQCANRLRELARGGSRHGSCGAGFGETVADGAQGDRITARDLRDTVGLRHRLEQVRARKRQELEPILQTLHGVAEAASEIELLTSAKAFDGWLGQVRRLVDALTIVEPADVDRTFARPGVVVFEGAQGVLLDERHGFFPFVTFSTCTAHNALALLAEHGQGRPDVPYRLGVTRTYAVRHGAGPLPTNDEALAVRLAEPHNVEGPWQGAVRRGWLDRVLLRYAIAASGGIDGLALTHLDALARLPDYRICTDYTHDADAAPRVGAADNTLRIERAVPRFTSLAPRASLLVDRLQRDLEVPVVLTSSGPCADAVETTL